MKQGTSRLAATLFSAAALSMVATPALAGPRWGWGGHRHHDRVDAGDIFTGILIIGGIAAIASAANSDKKKRDRYERRDRDDRYERDYARDDERPQWQEGTGVNGAINRCLGEVTRGANQNAEIDAVNRDGDGWKVEGRADGGDFSCTIDGAGRIRNIQISR